MFHFKFRLMRISWTLRLDAPPAGRSSRVRAAAENWNGGQFDVILWVAAAELAPGEQDGSQIFGGFVTIVTATKGVGCHHFKAIRSSGRYRFQGDGVGFVRALGSGYPQHRACRESNLRNTQGLAS